jgi:hypothetical protein
MVGMNFQPEANLTLSAGWGEGIDTFFWVDPCDDDGMFQCRRRRDGSIQEENHENRKHG